MNKQAIQEQYENHESLQIKINVNLKMQEIKMKKMKKFNI